MSVGIHSFYDYVAAGPQQTIKLVKEQKQRYLQRRNQAFRGYQAIFAGLRRAVQAEAPTAELHKALSKAQGWQQQAFPEITDGFQAWWETQSPVARGVHLRQTWHQLSGLTVTVQNLFGLQHHDGTVDVVMPYVKGPEVTRDAANVVLRLLEHTLPKLHPQAERAVLLDTRRGRQFRLSNNRSRHDLDAYLSGQAAGYQAHWHQAA